MSFFSRLWFATGLHHSPRLVFEIRRQSLSHFKSLPSLFNQVSNNVFIPLNLTLGMFVATVLYHRPANDPNPRFDLDYYTEEHIQPAVDIWKIKGSQSYRVVSYLNDPRSSIAVLLMMEWPDEEIALREMGDPELRNAAEADVINYTDLSPVIVKGRSVVNVRF